MEFEAWYLLVIPLFFALGWVAARVDIRHVMQESRAVPRSYFKGLNYLLNEQPDKAIEAFLEVAKMDPDTLELHFALGALFRRRGELDRAIRIHQNLVDRADLSQDQRMKALYELGQDFLKSGLLDRAERKVLVDRLHGRSDPLDQLGVGRGGGGDDIGEVDPALLEAGGFGVGQVVGDHRKLGLRVLEAVERGVEGHRGSPCVEFKRWWKGSERRSARPASDRAGR